MIALLVAMCLGLAYGRFFPVERRAQAWEYSVVYVPGSTMAADLNEAGSLGWEVVSARWAKTSDDQWGYELIMKRPR